MRSKVTVVLLFLNVVLFAYIYFYDKPRIEKLQSLGAIRRVFGPEAATITSFTRTSRGGEKIKLEKATDSWWLTAPYRWPASPNAVASLLNAIELLDHDTSFPVADLAKGGRSLADYGLADPAMTLEFTSGDHPPYVVQIGDVTTVGNRLYLLSPDKSRIHVVNRSFAEAIGLPLDTLRAPSIFSVPVFEVRSLNVQSLNAQTTPPSSLKVRLRRDAAARWAFEAPITARASKAAVEVTINAVNALSAQHFADPRDADLERAGLNAPTLQVTLEGNARRETLLIGNPTGNKVPREGSPTPDTEYFAKMEDNAVVFSTALPKELENVLRTAQEALRDPRVLDFEPDTVTSLTLTAPGQPDLTLQKIEEGQGWQAVVRVSGAAPQTTPADAQVVDDLLQKIAQLAAHEARPNAPKFLSDAPSASDLENWGFNRPAREITLNLKAGAAGPLAREASSLTLQIGVSPDKPGEAFARSTNAPFVYQVLPDILEVTPVAARHYRQRVLRELPKEARITSLKLTGLPANNAILSLSNAVAITPESLASAAFTPVEAAPGAPAAAPLSEPARAVIASLLTELRKLRAKAYTPATFTPDHADTAKGPQPWKYQLEIVTAFAAGTAPAQNTTLTLLLTDRLGGSTMLAGTTEFGGVVFEVTQELLDAIFALIYSAQQDPGMPKPEPVPAEAPKTEAPATPETKTPPPTK
jgi:hypothetical protein